jgi:hypothetical protein
VEKMKKEEFLKVAKEISENFKNIPVYLHLKTRLRQAGMLDNVVENLSIITIKQIS